MTWVKLDDNALDDPAFVKLSRGVRLFHLEALAWSNRHAAGGHIPAAAALRFTDEERVSEAVQTLVAAGLWELADDGYRIVWLLDDQPTPAEIEATRERNREKQKRHRNHLRGEHRMCDPKWCKAANRVTNGVTNRGSNDSPSRPDPTLPEGEGEGIGVDVSAPRAHVAPRDEQICSLLHLYDSPDTTELARSKAGRMLVRTLRVSREEVPEGLLPIFDEVQSVVGVAS